MTGKFTNEYDSNEIAADNKYKKKYVRVSGTVEDLGKDILDDIYVTLDGGGADDMGLRAVQAYFKKSDSDAIAQVAKGQSMTVVCRVDGLMMNVILKDCVIE